MTTKSAAVLLLDVSMPDAGAVRAGVAVCRQFMTERMLFARSDEVALALCGTADSLNPLHTATAGARYAHLTVAAPLAAPTLPALAPLLRLEEDLDKAGPPAAATSAGKGGRTPKKGAKSENEEEEAKKSGEAPPPALPGARPFDLLEALLLAAQMLHDGTSGKKYSRSVYFITDARHPVARKEELEALRQAMAAEAVDLIVVGVDFTESAADVGGSWEGLSVKQQNERVLLFLCDALAGSGGGGASLVATPAEALASLSALRRRKVLQRPLMKVVLQIGDVRIATQLFTKAAEERLPTLKKVTRLWQDVRLATQYVPVSAGVGGTMTAAAGASTTTAAAAVPPEQRVRAYRYGRSLVPCTEADLEAMAIRGPRSLQTIAFVPLSQLPPFILMGGGTKALLPLAGDHDGQRALASFVAAMQQTRSAAVVRHVRTRDAAPQLLALVPPDPARPSRKNCLYVARLPFAEDVRLLRFPEHRDLGLDGSNSSMSAGASAGAGLAKEQAMVDELVEALTVDKETLRPCETFNPTLHQYYATLRGKSLAAAARLAHHHEGEEAEQEKEKEKEASGASKDSSSTSRKKGTSKAAAAAPGGGADSSPADDAGGEPVPLLPQLIASSTGFALPGNALEPSLRAARPLLDRLAAAFPFAEDRDADGAARAPQYWFRQGGGGGGGGGADESDEGSAAAAAPPTTVAALLRHQPVSGGSKRHPHGGGGGASESGSEVSTVAAAGVLAAAATHVTTIDPVGTFNDLAARAAAAADGSGPARQQRAMDELAAVVTRLLEGSYKAAQRDKCDDCVAALRTFCVAQQLPHYFNSFLVRLGIEARELGLAESFWDPRAEAAAALAVSGGGGGKEDGKAAAAAYACYAPITRAECAASDIADGAAAAAFLMQDRALPPPPAEVDDLEDDLMDLIS